MIKTNNDERYVQNYSLFYLFMFVAGLNVGMAIMNVGSFLFAVGSIGLFAGLYYMWYRANEDISNRSVHQIMDLAVISEQEYVESGTHLSYHVAELLNTFDGGSREVAQGVAYMFDMGLIDVEVANGDNLEKVLVVEKTPYTYKFLRVSDNSVVREEDLRFSFINGSAKYFFDGRNEGRHKTYQETFS